MALLLFSITSFIDVLLCGSCNINLRGGGGGGYCNFILLGVREIEVKLLQSYT